MIRVTYFYAKLLLFFCINVLYGEIFYKFSMEICFLCLDVQILEGEVAKMVLIFLLFYVEEYVTVEGDVSHGDVIGI